MWKKSVKVNKITATKHLMLFSQSVAKNKESSLVQFLSGIWFTADIDNLALTVLPLFF